jgi:hypothetical protein
MFGDLFLFDNDFSSSFFIKNDSIFYKTVFLRAADASFHKENLFFYDRNNYDFFNLDFINYQIFPNRGSIDLYKNKVYGRDNVSFKPKMMSFKIFLSII